MELFPSDDETRHPQLVSDLGSGHLCFLSAMEDPELNGNQGRLRAPAENCDLDATHDLGAVGEWLARKAMTRSPATVRAYRREAERLLRWCWGQRKVAMSDLKDVDFTVYRAFLLDPQPRKDWVYARSVRRSNPKWRIFQRPMTESNVAYTFTILNELFNWLSSKGYLVRNPIAFDQELRAKPKSDASPTRFAFTNAAWDAVVETVETMARKTKKEIAAYERLRYLLTLCYLMDFRLGDLANNSMGAFQRITYKGNTYWSWCGVGKGKRSARIPANKDVMAAVSRYRMAMGCTHALPHPDDKAPMVMSLTGTKTLGEDRIYRLIKDVFQCALNRELSKGVASELDPHDLEILRHASTHWLRHTSVTRQLESGISLSQVQKLARHSDPKTTSRYDTGAFVQLYEASEQHKLRGQWCFA